MTRRKDTGAEPQDQQDAVDAQVTEAMAATMPEAPAAEDRPLEIPLADPAEQTAPLPSAPPARRSGVLGPLLGGALAALGGFGLSHFNVFGLAAPDSSVEVAALGQRLDVTLAELQAGQTDLDKGLRQGIDGLAGRVAVLETAPEADVSGLAALEQRLRVIEALPVGGEASTAALATQLAELERRIAALPTDAADTAKIDAALARLTAAEAEAVARAAEAAALAEATARARALEVLVTAVASGAGFESELAAVADPDLQAALAPHVAGVTSLAQLQADFPQAARAVLQLARAADTEAGWGTRLLDFLGAQTGARSLTPQEGADPDAILSRAEFALAEGRLPDALGELQALDPAIRAPLETWIAAAGARVAVDAALAGAM